MTAARARQRVVVTGRVQGVGFRQSCAARAERLGVAGWVRNRRNGTVEAVFEGDTLAVAQMVEWCRVGPPMASVTAARATDEVPEGLDGFGLRATR